MDMKYIQSISPGLNLYIYVHIYTISNQYNQLHNVNQQYNVNKNVGEEKEHIYGFNQMPLVAQIEKVNEIAKHFYLIRAL